MGQVIPDKAVEAAAEWLPHSDDCEVRPERDCTCWQLRVDLMRAALEAAAPYLMAELADSRDGDLFRFTWAQRGWLRDRTLMSPTRNSHTPSVDNRPTPL